LAFLSYSDLRQWVSETFMSAIFSFELGQRGRTKAMPAANLRRGNSGLLLFDYPNNLVSVKRLFRIHLLLRKAEKTLHQSEGGFGAQVRSILGELYSHAKPEGFIPWLMAVKVMLAWLLKSIFSG
jgi:hypothetical protein